MSRLVLAIVLVFSSGFAQATPCDRPAHQAPCPASQIREVGLQISSRELTEHGSVGCSADSSYESAADGAGVSDLPMRRLIVSSAGELRRRLIDLAHECVRVRLMLFDTHGEPGAFWLNTESPTSPDAAVSVDNMQSVLGGLSCLMRPNARIQFTSCDLAGNAGGSNGNTACEGEDFMRNLATHLLNPGGGSITANTAAGVSIFCSAAYSENFNTQTLTVGSSLSSPRWEDARQSVATCRGLLATKRQELATLRASRPCAGPDTATPLLDAAISQQDALGASPGFQARARAGVSYRAALTEARRQIAALSALRCATAARSFVPSTSGPSGSGSTQIK